MYAHLHVNLTKHSSFFDLVANPKLQTTNNNERLDSPIFAKQGDSGSPNRDGSAGPIDVPHCESDLGTLGKVWVLDWQPQPLIPAAQDSRRGRAGLSQCTKEINVWGTEMSFLSYRKKGFATDGKLIEK